MRPCCPTCGRMMTIKPNHGDFVWRCNWGECQPVVTTTGGAAYDLLMKPEMFRTGNPTPNKRREYFTKEGDAESNRG